MALVGLEKSGPGKASPQGSLDLRWLTRLGLSDATADRKGQEGDLEKQCLLSFPSSVASFGAQ